MNRLQKTVAFLATLLILAMGLFPPWKFIFHIPNEYHSVEKSGTYSFALSQPGLPERHANFLKSFANYLPPGSHIDLYYDVHIDFTKLFAQWALVLLVTIGLVGILQGRTGSRRRESDR